MPLIPSLCSYVCRSSLVSLVTVAAFARLVMGQAGATSVVQQADGQIIFPSSAAVLEGNGARLVTQPVPAIGDWTSTNAIAKWSYKPTRWGAYELGVEYDWSAGAATSATHPDHPTFEARIGAATAVVVDSVTADVGAPGRWVVSKRFYLPTSDPFDLTLRRLPIPPGAAGLSSVFVRSVVLRPAPEGDHPIQSDEGTISLHARDATTHSVMMRYEPATNKNCLGYWVNPADSAQWSFDVKRPGKFDIEVRQGCGKGQGGSLAAVEVNGARFLFEVEETGHFQNFFPRRVGRILIAAPGQGSLSVKPVSKKADAVMDIREVRLVPVRTPDGVSEPAGAVLGARRVVVLGDSIAYGGEWVEFLEAWFRLEHPGSVVDFINLGLPSETVSGLSEPGHAGGAFPRPDLRERLTRVMERARPDVILCCYGMNDGIYFPPDPERMGKFQEGMRRLRDFAGGIHATVIHITPSPFDPLPLKGRTLPAGLAEYPAPFEGYDLVLEGFSKWLLEEGSKGWIVVDTHAPLNAYVQEKRKDAPSFTLAGDGVHLNTQGHWLVARELLRSLGAKQPVLSGDQPASLTDAYANGAAVLELVQKKQRLLKDTWLTLVAHKRPGMNPGKPLAEAEIEAAHWDAAIERLTRRAAEAPSAVR